MPKVLYLSAFSTGVLLAAAFPRTDQVPPAKAPPPPTKAASGDASMVITGPKTVDAYKEVLLSVGDAASYKGIQWVVFPFVADGTPTNVPGQYAFTGPPGDYEVVAFGVPTDGVPLLARYSVTINPPGPTPVPPPNPNPDPPPPNPNPDPNPPVPPPPVIPVLADPVVDGDDPPAPSPWTAIPSPQKVGIAARGLATMLDADDPKVLAFVESAKSASSGQWKSGPTTALRRYVKALAAKDPEPMLKLTGLKKPVNIVAIRRAQRTRSVGIAQNLKAAGVAPPSASTLFANVSPKLARFDWRDHGVVSSVKDQGQCGDCWVFGGIGAFQGSGAIYNRARWNLSEAMARDCSGDGSCNGGWLPFDYFEAKGVGKEGSDPYYDTDMRCPTGVTPLYKAINWGYVGSADDSTPPTVDQLKQALCDYGPLWITITATDNFMSYTDGVYSERTSAATNHVVTLVGWDDSTQSWQIMNSWGSGWGIDGAAKVRRDSLRIAEDAAWIQAAVGTVAAK